MVYFTVQEIITKEYNFEITQELVDYINKEYNLHLTKKNIEDIFYDSRIGINPIRNTIEREFLQYCNCKLNPYKEDSELRDYCVTGIYG